MTKYNITPETLEQMKNGLINQIRNCEKIPVEKIFKAVCDKYNSWFIWYIPILALWYFIVPVIANIIFKIYVKKKSKEIQDRYMKCYSILFDVILFTIIMFGCLMWCYMAYQNNWFAFLGFPFE